MLERIKRTYIAQLNFNNLDSNCFKQFKSKLLAWMVCQDICAFMQVVEYCYAWIHNHECKTQPDEFVQIRRLFVKLFSHFMKCHDQVDDKQEPEKIEKYYHLDLKGYDSEDVDKKYYHFNLKGYDPEDIDKIGQIAEKTLPDDHIMLPTYFISNGKMREMKDKNGELALGRKQTDSENAILFKKPKIAIEEKLQSTGKHDPKTDPDLLQSNYLSSCLYLAAHVNNFHTMELFVSRAKEVTETSKTSFFCKQSELQLWKERLLINSNNKLEIGDLTRKPDDIVNAQKMGVKQVIAKFMKQKQVVADEYEKLTKMCTFLDSYQQITEHEIHVAFDLQLSKKTDEDMYISERSKERHEGGGYGSLIDYNDPDFLLGLTDKLKAPKKLLRTHHKRKVFLPKFENESIRNIPEGTGRTDDFSTVAVRYRVAILIYARYFCFTQPSSQGTSPASRTQWLDIVQSMAPFSANAQLLVRVICMVFKQRTAKETRTVCLQLEMQHSQELDITFMTNTNNDFILELMAWFRQQMTKTENEGSDDWLFTVSDTYLALRISYIRQWQQLDLAKVFQGSVSKQLMSPAFLAATRSSPLYKASIEAGICQGVLIQANQALFSGQAQVPVEMKMTDSITDNPTVSLTLSSPQQSVYVQETEGLSTQTAKDSEALAVCSEFTQSIDQNKASLASIATSSASTSVEITHRQLPLSIQANTPPESFTVYDGPTVSFSFRASDNSNTNTDQQIMQLYPSLRLPVQVTATVGLSIGRSSVEDLFIESLSIECSSIEDLSMEGSSIESEVCSSQGKPMFDETALLSRFTRVANCENRYFTSNTQNTRRPNISLVQVRDQCCATKGCVENVSAVGVTSPVHAETDSGLMRASVSTQSDLVTSPVHAETDSGLMRASVSTQSDLVTSPVHAETDSGLMRASVSTQSDLVTSPVHAETDSGLMRASVSTQSDLRTRPVSTALTSHFLSEPHAAGSLPPWATGTPRIQLSEAASPEYINLMKRCGTYSNWPETSGQHPRNLALAGFYYTGKDRQIRCFFCGVVVQWSPDCNAWEEHIRRSPTCQYLVQMKGEQFVTQVQSRQREKVKEENQ